MKETAEKKLIIDVLAGDHQAYAVLINRYQRPIFNTMLRMVHCREDAADLTQETFLRAYEKLEQFRLSARFFPWLYTIGMNMARDHLRKKKVIPDSVPFDGPDAASIQSPDSRQQEKTLLDKLEVEKLAQIMDALPVDYREALILRFQQGLDMQEIGTALGLSVSGAKMRVRRGLERLRGLLSDQARPGGNTSSAYSERDHAGSAN